MKEVNRSLTVVVEAMSPITGETIQCHGVETISETYHSIRNLTTRISHMTFLDMLTRIIRSAKDLEAVHTVLSKANSENTIYLNVTNTAKEIGISRSSLNRILKDCEKENLFLKPESGKYVVNPYVWIGMRTRSNKLRAKLQKDWSTLHSTTSEK